MPYVPRHLLSTSAMIAFIRTEPIEELLRYFVPTESDRKYLARCPHRQWSVSPSGRQLCSAVAACEGITTAPPVGARTGLGL